MTVLHFGWQTVKNTKHHISTQNPSKEERKIELPPWNVVVVAVEVAVGVIVAAIGVVVAELVYE